MPKEKMNESLSINKTASKRTTTRRSSTYESGVLMFRNKLNDLRTMLKILKGRGIIGDGTYYDYLLLIWKAKTIDQLDEIAHDLSEISKPLGHSISLQ